MTERIDAYDFNQVELDKAVKKIQSIDAIFTSYVAWGSLKPLVYIGTNDGCLHSYIPTKMPSISSPSSSLLSHLHLHSSFSMIYHPQAQFLDTWGIYATITSKYGVTFYSLPLPTNPYLNGNEMLSSGNLNDKIAIIEDSKDTLMINFHEDAKVLCCLSKQKVLKVYDYTVKGVIDIRIQHQLNAIPTLANVNVTQILIADENHTVLISKTDWWVMNINSGNILSTSIDINEIQKGGSIEFAVSFQSSSVSYTSQVVPAILIAYKQHSLVLSLESVTDSNVTLSNVIEYPNKSCPKSIHYHHPYLLMIFNEFVGVYLYNTGSGGTLLHAQDISIAGINQICSLVKCESREMRSNRYYTPACLAISTMPSFSMQIFSMHSLAQQMQRLLKTPNLIKNAITLYSLVPEECNLSKKEQDELHAKYGLTLFKQKNYADAMIYFTRGYVEIQNILSMFPKKIHPCYKNFTLELPISDMNTDTTEYTQDSIHGIFQSNEELVPALIALVNFINRQKILHLQTRTLQDTPKQELLDTICLKCLVVLCDNGQVKESIHYQQLLDLVTDVSNCCNVSEAELVLSTRSMFDVLLRLYTSKRMHRKVLEMLEEVANDPNTNNTKEWVVKSVQYLRQLGNSHSKLVFEFARTIISSYPNLGLSIFTQSENKLESDIDPTKVVNYLKTCTVSACSMMEIDAETSNALPLSKPNYLVVEFLTNIIYDGSRRKLLSPKLHDEVVYLLLDCISQESRGKSDNQLGVALLPRVNMQRGLVGLLRRKLLAFLEYPKAKYTPERMLSRIPNELVDEHTAILSKLGRHHDVLKLLVLELKDNALAESYCNKYYDAQVVDKSIYSTLLQLYLHPVSNPVPKGTTAQQSKSSNDAIASAVKFLNMYADRIDLPVALDLLPPEVQLQSITPFLVRALEMRVEDHRNGQVQKQLSKMENFMVREMLTAKRKTSVTIWSSNSCQVCDKKLGVGAFLRYPNGALIHYACQPAP